MISPRFGLPPQLFADIFPFHLAFNQDGWIVQVTDVLQRICPKLSLGSQLEEHFWINRPQIPIEFNAIRSQSRCLFLLKSLHNGMQLKGQMVYVQESEVIFFLCSPWVTNVADLKPLGLSLKDFAIHDPVADFLFLLQAQNTALADAKKLTNKLTLQRAELREANRKLAVQYAVTRTLAESLTISEAALKILAAICDTFNWQIGALWSLDKHSALLRCQEVWKASPTKTAFDSLTRRLTFASGVGLPGRVWRSGQPVWITDIINDDNFLCRPYVAEAGLKVALGFPIISGSEVIGVLEIFSGEIREPDDGLLEVMADVGIKIGQFIQRKRAEEALRESEKKYRSVVDNLKEVIFQTDATGSWTFLNPAWTEMTGFTVEESIGTPFLNYVHPDDRQSHLELFQTLIEGHKEYCKQEMRYLTKALPLSLNVSLSAPYSADAPSRKAQPQEVQEQALGFPEVSKRDGGFRWFEVLSRLTLDANGTIIGISGTLSDITERKQAEEEIRKALEKEKELSFLKSHFITMTSHEFRTPLTAIQGSADLLEHYSHKFSEEKKLTHLHRIQSSVKNLVQLLESVMVIGKAESGELEFQPCLLDLVQFCRSLVEEMQLNAGEGHAITFASLGQSIDACMDEKLLRHIFTNLLSNAINYSPQGGIVNFDLAYSDKEAIFQIQDRGIGIPPQDLQRLFEPFSRAKNVGKIPGKGLGLTIVKKYVELHRGAIAVTSEIQVGTKFTITLPLNKETKANK